MTPRDQRSIVPRTASDWSGFIGGLLLISGTVLMLLVLADRASGLPFQMPPIWYSSLGLWFLIGLALFAAGWTVSRGSSESRPSRSVFQSVVVYTRDECPLCDQAKDVLGKYSAALPDVEEIDINTDDQLLRAFGQSVPVVEIDGRVRFRGCVNEILLRRLMNATKLQRSNGQD